MNLSIIIVSFNTKELTKQCLKSLRKSQIGISHEVIVVDNGSSDDTVPMIEAYFPDAVLLLNMGNERFAKACNQALDIANGDHVLLLNSDTIVHAGSIEKLFDFIRGHPACGCVGPRLLYPDGRFQSEGWAFSYRTRFIACYLTRLDRWPVPGRVKEILLPKGFLDFRRGETREVEGIMGAAMMFRRRDLLAVGGLNEELYFYGEENVVCAYLRNKLGLKTYVLPESTISHVHGGSTSTSFDQLSDRLIMESYNVMVRETVGYVEFFLNCLIRMPVYLGMFTLGYLVNSTLKNTAARQMRLYGYVLSRALGISRRSVASR